METLPKILQQRKRIVIKIGSGLLVEQNRLQSQWLDQFSAELAALKRHNIDVAVISSGAVALGENQIARARTDWRLEQKQAAAAIGQIALAHHWHLAFARHHLIPAQILLTLQDTEQRTRHLNARATIRALFKEQAIPVINENDTVATTQIRYGDNDRLAARLATMISAD
ncbi:MAG: glutamate 5-kinase, partial [Pseudomonadota bacterium]